MKAKLVIPCLFVALGSGYGYIKYYNYSNANLRVEYLIKQNQLRDHLFNLHDTISHSFDKLMNQYENYTRISQYRRILCSFCEGEVLETCSGTARNLKYYKEGTQLTLLDHSPSCLQMSMNKVNSFITTKHELGSVQSLPFDNNKFDTVIDTFGLDYVMQPSAALKEMRRVCKPGGNILLLQSGISNLWYTKWWEDFKAGSTLLTMGYFSNRNWEQIIEDEGFQIVEKERKINGSIYFYVLRNNK